MPLHTDLQAAPFFDDYDQNKDFYKILFQPSVAVQARELNQLQTILQNQIEKFGDNIFRRGTIVDGCNITFHSNLPYVKIRDVETDGTPVNILSYKNLYVKNASNVNAYIVETESGFETRSPDLNTLFVKYNSTGNDGNTSTFSESEPLTVYDTNYPIFRYRVIDGASGFANTDTVEVISSIAIQNTTGGKDFSPGSYQVNQVIQNGVANAIIVEANTTANTEALLLRIKPLPVDLQSANTIKWKFNNTETIRDATTSEMANITEIIGQGAGGVIVTDALGKIVSIAKTSDGEGYYYPPHVAVSITSGGSTTVSEINQLNVTPQNYLTNITVANTSVNPIGTGFGVGIDEGVIYQQGYFLRVDDQFIVVNKYSNEGFDKSLGFNTQEIVVDSNMDTSLLDNATGSPNESAPGANRLKLVPELIVLEKSEADANSEFLPIVEFSDGKPYKQNQTTVYNVIGDEMARRRYEESGNYVLDPFILSTKDSTPFTDTPANFKINVDPGVAYINGYRVETSTNYSTPVKKGTDTIISNNSTIKVGYGNYLNITNLGGIFPFNTGALIELYSDVANPSVGTNIIAPSNKIGTARLRSLVLDEGTGFGAIYRLYLFDIEMDSGANFSSTKSVFYGGVNSGSANVKLDNGLAILKDTAQAGLLYKPVNAIKYANSISYTYRTLDQGKVANTTGFITVTPAAGEHFPYTGELNSIEERDIIIVPLDNYQAGANAPGGVEATTGSNIITGSGSANFINSFVPGDYVKIHDNQDFFIGEIEQVISVTSMRLTSPAPSDINSGNVVISFPKNTPISISTRDNRTANVAANGQMVISLGTNIANTSGSSASANVAIVYNSVANNVNPAAKTSNRGAYVRITGNDTVSGPWCLGFADVYRLRSIHALDVSSQTQTFNSMDIDNNFIPIQDVVFQDGDELTYGIPAGGTSISSSLNSGDTVYVVDSNTSGFSISLTLGGAVLPLDVGIISETHSFTGQPLHFTEDNVNAVDVTNDYYIDTNQREDFLDISYLYKKPRASNMNSTDVLLVKFDVFTTGPGVKTASSYSINDSLTLPELVQTTEINTLEIPEITGTNGQYYDIRDQIDFRPISANTVAISTNAANAPVDPGDVTAIDRFGNNEQRFPVPNSQMTVNLEYYTPRNARVILNRNNEFSVVEGLPNVTDTFPAQPLDSITIQYLVIPPYPSLPYSLSKDTVNILDTKVANEKYGQRKDNFTIVTPMGEAERNKIQVPNFKNSDIAKLERRVDDLEYYVSFTLAEAMAKSRYIPSANGNNDRFKFGFFVDPFTDYRYSDLENPEYNAIIKDDLLYPKDSEINLKLDVDNILNGDVGGDGSSVITIPFDEFNLISQNDATDGELVDESVSSNDATDGGLVDESVSSNVIISTVTQSTATVYGNYRNTSRSDSPPFATEEWFYTMSSTPGPVEFYINSRDNNIAIHVHQRANDSAPWTLIATTAQAQAITSADFYAKGLSGLGQGRTIEHLGSTRRKSYGPSGGFMEDQLKLLWQHNPDKGTQVKIIVFKGKNHGAQGKGGQYGFKLFYPADTVTNKTVTITRPSEFKYVGIVHDIKPANFTISMSVPVTGVKGQVDLSKVNVADAQKFEIVVAGLKPNTKHRFFIGDEDLTSKCSQKFSKTPSVPISSLGGELLSDDNGSIQVDFYYDAGIDESSSDLLQQYKLITSFASQKNFIFKNNDNSSTAVGEIKINKNLNTTEEQLKEYINNSTSINSYDYSSNLNNTGGGITYDSLAAFHRSYSSF